jgi:LAO/AO transport system kinase
LSIVPASGSDTYSKYLQSLKAGDFQALSHCITLVENSVTGYREFLKSLPADFKTPVIGITGPPGSGKSTLVDALVSELKDTGARIAVLAVDPSSPFTSGSLLGDRIRMSRQFNNERVFIRSMASRGSAGGLSPKIIEVSDLVKAAAFDYLFIETVGVGQGEVEIAGVADVTVVVLVPGAGDSLQMLKSGLMEVADIFVVNKSDLPQASGLEKQLLENMKYGSRVPVIRTEANAQKGIAELLEAILVISTSRRNNTDRQSLTLAYKTASLIREMRMKDILIPDLREAIMQQLHNGTFNLYDFVERLA